MNRFNYILTYASEKFHYTNIPTIIWDHITLSSYKPSAIAIRVYMRHYREWKINKGISHLSTPQIVHEFGCARSSVTDSIKKLKEMDLIEVVQLSKHSSIADKWTSKTIVTPKFPSTLIEEMKLAKTRKRTYKDPNLGEIYEFEDLLSKIYARECEAEKTLRDNASRLRKVIRGYFINKTLTISHFIELYKNENIDIAENNKIKKEDKSKKNQNNGADEIHRILNQSKHEEVEEKLYNSLAAQITWYVYGQLLHLSEFLEKDQNTRDETAILKKVCNQRWNPPKGYPVDFTHRCFGEHTDKTKKSKAERGMTQKPRKSSHEEI